MMTGVFIFAAFIAGLALGAGTVFWLKRGEP